MSKSFTHIKSATTIESKSGVNLISSLQENTILVSVGDKKTRCLIDIGATISCASLEFLKKTKLDISHLKPADIAYIAGVGNKTHEV